MRMGFLLAKDAERAFCSGENLAAILTAQAAIDGHLRYEIFCMEESKDWSFFPIDWKKWF